jgi:hypothetical protein
MITRSFAFFEESGDFWVIKSNVEKPFQEFLITKSRRSARRPKTEESMIVAGVVPHVTVSVGRLSEGLVDPSGTGSDGMARPRPRETASLSDSRHLLLFLSTSLD